MNSPFPKIRTAGFAFLFLSAAIENVNAQSEPFHVSRLSTTIVLDGHVTDDEWGEIEPLPTIVYAPVFGADPTERTEIRVAYDDNYIYLAGRLYDSDPEGIRGNSLYRDRWSGDDTFAIILDTFNDNETALWFFTSPLGVRFDMSVSNDVNFTGGSAFGSVMNSSWNTYWDVATQMTDEGWFAEMRIPYSSLGFQDDDGRVEMGMIVYRYIARKNERHLYPAIPPNWDMGFAKPSQAQKIVLENVRSKKPIYITPYALGGGNTTVELNDDESAYLVESDPTTEIGLDIKYNVTSNLTADLTVNTDFAQVEADDQQVNLGRFSLFFPEKRQFFQERAGIFEFGTGFQERLFHSRQIGVNEGEVIRIYGGGRLVGRVGTWDVGLINMQTADSPELPSENFGVARLRRRVFNAFSNAGGMVTSRIGVDGSYNVAYGLDGVVRVTGDEYATLKFSQSFDHEVADEFDFDFLESSQIYARWDRRTARKFAYGLMFKRTGRDYRPGTGFIRRENVTQGLVRLSYGWFAPVESVIRRLEPRVFTSNYFRNDDGTLESSFVGARLDFEFKNGAEANLEFDWNYEDIRGDTLSFPEDTEVFPGSYAFAQIGARYSLARGSLFRGQMRINGGSFYGGTKLDLGLGPTWNVSRHLELSAEYAVTRVTLPEEQEFTLHLVRLRTQIGINTKASFNAFVQFNSDDSLFAANARFRYNFAEGRDFWLVYDEGINIDRMSRDPIPPASSGRTVLVKYTHTFGL